MKVISNRLFSLMCAGLVLIGCQNSYSMRQGARNLAAGANARFWAVLGYNAQEGEVQDELFGALPEESARADNLGSNTSVPCNVLSVEAVVQDRQSASSSSSYGVETVFCSKDFSQRDDSPWIAFNFVSPFEGGPHSVMGVAHQIDDRVGGQVLLQQYLVPSQLHVNGGIATTDDSLRKLFFERDPYAISKAVADGFDVRGSFDKKMGLFSVDRESEKLTRSLKSSAQRYVDIVNGRIGNEIFY